jgi:pyrroline-5-carboxylate reductase
VKSLGFIGTGNLASFFVEGLARAGAPYAITVSERNKQASAALRARFGVRVAAESQVLVDECEMIVVSVLPHQAGKALAGLKFHEGQTVLSVMAGVSLAELRKLAAPAACAVSMMPGLANACNAGPSVLFPGEPRWRALLSILGPVHVYADQDTYNAASVMGAFSGLTVLMMRDAVNWYEANGLAVEDARQLVAEVLLGNASMLLATPLALPQITRGVVTPGGITAQAQRLLEEGKSWSEALDAVLLRLARD